MAATTTEARARTAAPQSSGDGLSDPALATYRSFLPPGDFVALNAWASTFYPFQRAWLFDDGRLGICNKSRQIGTSHTTAGVGVLWGAFHGELTTVISVGEKEAVEVLDKCRRHVGVLQNLGSTMARTVRSSKDEITFHSGGRIIALPSTGGRSFSGNVFLDEYAYQQHASQVWDNAAPVTTLGHKLRIVSTPNGVGNEFHDVWERAVGDESGRWHAHQIPLQLAIEQGYPVDIGFCWELAKGDPRLFDQMYNCSFLDNVYQYIPSEVIEECCTDELLSPAAGDEYYGGLDIGREIDLSALAVVALAKGKRRLVWMKTLKRTDNDELDRIVAEVFEKFKLRRLCIDATGLGAFPAERIKKQYSERIDIPHRRPRVECVDFTPTMKETLATGLYTAMITNALQLPANDANLPGCEPGLAKAMRREIASIRREVTSSANVRYDTPRTREGHGDRAWALMLALHAASSPNPMIEALRRRAGQ